MSSRFISGGKIDAESGEAVAAAQDKSEADKTSGTGGGVPANKGNVEWEAVQKELEAERKRREEARVKSVEGGGEKSLYDVLQANKAAKQAAFEEQNKIRNQFRALDEDEIDFLDDVRARKWREEEQVRLQDSEGLKAFREAQRVQEKQAGGASGNASELGEEGLGAEGAASAEEWKAGGARKRKRHERELKGVVRRRTSLGSGDGRKTSEENLIKGHSDGAAAANGEEEKKNKERNDAESGPVVGEYANGSNKEMTTMTTTTSASPPKAAPKPALGLAAYGSDDDDDD